MASDSRVILAIHNVLYDSLNHRDPFSYFFLAQCGVLLL